MLRRATTGLHRQCRPHRPLSRLGNSRNPSSSSSTIPEVEDDAFAEGEKKNSTFHALSDAGITARASASGNNDATHITHRGRIRSLPPILIPPSFPSSGLLPVRSIPETSFSGDQNTETTPSSSSTTKTVTLTNLPPNTVKADIRPFFQRFGEITRIFVQQDERHADVVFADVHGVKRTLHAYAEKPLRVRGREIVMFRKYTKIKKVSDMDTDSDTPSATRTEQGRDDGGIFVSNFPPTTTQEEILEALGPFGKYEQFVMRMSFALLSVSLKQVGFLSGLIIIGPGSKRAHFIYSNEDRVEDILSVHQQVPITVGGRTLRIERAENRPYRPSPGYLGDDLEFGKPLDPATSSAILKELTRMVSGFKGSHNPSRVLWIGGLPTRISRVALANFWSRVGCVVDVRPCT
jgi:hypothetical protein